MAYLILPDNFEHQSTWAEIIRMYFGEEGGKRNHFRDAGGKGGFWLAAPHEAYNEENMVNIFGAHLEIGEIGI